MNKITIVSLGPEPAEQNLCLGALNAMKKAKKLILRTEQVSAADLLKAEGIEFEPLDFIYDNVEDFDIAHAQAAEYILKEACESEICYAVIDTLHDGSVKELYKQNADVLTLVGVSVHAPYVFKARLESPYIVTDAVSLKVYSAQYPICIIELENKLLAGDSKLSLAPYFGDDADILFFENESTPYKKIKLFELDRQDNYSHRTCAIILLGKLPYKSRYDMEDLLELMRILRSDNGCPWDRKQTHKSLRPFLIEEAYEAAIAIDEGDWDSAADELGDVLLQIALHSVIGEEYASMTFQEIVSGICKKMVLRHPHVFADENIGTIKELRSSWENIKKQERGYYTVGDAMLDLKRGLPPLIRAEKVQKKAADVGFDWDKPKDVLQKVHEEANEVMEEIRLGNDPSEEIGDLFFACINLSRLCGLDSENLINMATKKFIKRFVFMEKEAELAGKALKSLTIDEMSVYWERSKAGDNR